MIVDAFTFYNELKMLEYRFKLLNDKVDFFIIVEARHTFNGNNKELYYDNNKDKFNEYKDKIIHVIVDDMPNNKNPWNNEFHQRNSIKRGINKLSLDDNDIIIISDVDEIPNIELMLKYFNKDAINCLESKNYYYNLTCVGHWSDRCCSKVVTYKLFKKYSPQQIRKCEKSIKKNKINTCGWHLSFFGDNNFILNKLKEFSHVNDSFVKDITNKSEEESIKIINERIKNNKDLFLRKDTSFKFLSITDNDYLPPNYEFFLN